MRCFARDGVANTSMADIITESGLSAGSIYSHFASKAELFRYVAVEILEDRSNELVADAATKGHVITPREVFLNFTPGLAVADMSRVLLHVWNEVPNDPELAEVALSNLRLIEEHIARLLTPWAEGKFGSDAPARLALETVALLTMAQGAIVRSALLPEVEMSELRTRLASRFADD